MRRELCIRKVMSVEKYHINERHYDLVIRSFVHFPYLFVEIKFFDAVPKCECVYQFSPIFWILHGEPSVELQFFKLFYFIPRHIYI